MTRPDPAWLAKLSAEERLGFEGSALCLAFNQELYKALEEDGLDQKQFAERVGVSPTRVSAILQGGLDNVELKTAAKLALGLGRVVEIRLVKDVAVAPKAAAKKGKKRG